MAITLFEQPYATNIRTITGATNLVTQDDYVLLCDTSSAPVGVQLASIPTNFWSTQYKLFVVDSGNNASSNSITITAPIGFTINGQPSASIIVNGAGYMITISSNTNYAGLYSGVISGTTSIGLINITNANLIALVNAGTVSAGQFYFVTNVSNVDSASGEGVAVQGIKVNGVTTVEGSGTFWNADYQGVGDYSGVPSYANNVGIWSTNPPASFVVGSVAIYNNLNYLNISGLWGSAPSGDVANWQLLGKAKTNGYILEQDNVKYDLLNNIVVYRADKRNNEVDSYTSGGDNSLLLFQWGRNVVKNNKVKSNSLMKTTNSWCSFDGNILDNGTLTDTTIYNVAGAGSYVGNLIDSGASVTMQLLTAPFKPVGNGRNAGTVSYNRFSEGVTIRFTEIASGVTFSKNVMEVINCILGNLTASISNKRCVSGFSNFEVTIRKPPYWKAPNQLLINPNYASEYSWVGIFYMENYETAIVEIEGLPTNHPCTFLVAPTSLPTFVLWFITDIATAQTNPLTIVGSSTYITVSTNNVMNFKTNGNNFIVIQKSGNLNQVVNFSENA
jgi:hypothetical protein